MKLPSVQVIRIALAETKPEFEALQAFPSHADGWGTLGSVMRDDKTVYDKIVFKP